MSDRRPAVDHRHMHPALVTVLRRYAAALIIVAGFVGAALLTFFGLIAVTGCFISCNPADEHPEGVLLIIGAIVLIPLTLFLAAWVADQTDWGLRAAVATGWLLGHGLLLLVAASTDLVDLGLPGDRPPDHGAGAGRRRRHPHLDPSRRCRRSSPSRWSA